ncbi:MAG: hypothetical protein ACRCZE_00805 [Candidatus Altimarinota bacterium]
MTSLDFLYVALGMGFIILVIFISVLLMHLVLLLRDVRKITDDVQNTTGRVKDLVFEPLKTLAKMSAGFSLVNDLVERLRSKFEDNGPEGEDSEEAEMEDEVGKKPKKKGFFRVNRLSE